MKTTGISALWGAFILACLLLSSCQEEEADVTFTEQMCSSKKDVKYAYYSPDPCCVGKMSYVTANACVSELVLECRNSEYLSITGVYDSKVGNDGQYREDDEIRGIENDGVYTSPHGGWSVTVKDSNRLHFVFERVDDKEENGFIAIEDATVSVTTPSGKNATLWVTRIFDGDMNLEK